MSAATTRFTEQRLMPAFSGSGRMIPVRLPGLANWPLGTVLGFVTGTGSPVNEVHRFTFGGTPSGGTFRVLFGTDLSGAIAWHATAATLAANIQTALLAMPSIGTGNVVVTGTGPFDATFGGALANKSLPLPTVISSLTGSSPTIAVSEQAVGHPGSGLAVPYNDAANDGSQAAAGFLVRAVKTNLAGELIEDRPSGYTSAEMYYQGPFYAADLVGLDAAALVDLRARVINGTSFSAAGAIILVP